MKKLILALLASAAFVAVGQQAYAFDGTVIFGSSDGKNNVVVSNSAGSTSVAFGANWAVEPGGSGAYAGTSGTVSYTNFTYTTATGVITSPAAPFTLWSFTSGGNTYTFKLDSPVSTGVNTPSVYQVSGTGTAYINGLDPTSGTWSLTGTSKNANFKFVSSSVTAVVPDGGSAVALLGIALAGIEGLRRKLGARKP
ncbi:MAG TPA: VPDSG-CTERM sorting domain-containing protein [Chthoniobacterales bacterium]|nr:VPDSG-CTERM sorting domain-containing protein [Chthoniobacterales bacterium]